MYSGTSCPVPTQLGSVVYPLLAPALMEALLASRFASVTRMVPGEADEWCALRARENPRSIIFTSDTDLLLYDYPSNVLVNFLKDEDASPEALKLYSPRRICEQLKLTSLVQLAYAVQNDRWKSLTEIAKEARNRGSASDIARYNAFNSRYIASVEIPTYLELASELEIPLQSLDARVSEFVLQSLAVTRADPPLENLPLANSIFLPLFMEDPFQASAWKHGQDIRRMAYSLLAPRRVVIQEHMRKAQGVSVQEFVLASAKEMTELAGELVNILGSQRQEEDGHKNEGKKHGEVLPPPYRWTLLAARLALQTLKPPHISLMTRVVTGEFDGTWSFIHLQACIQAVLYSLRIFKQCIAVYLAVGVANSPKARSPELESDIRKLHEALAPMPAIAEVFLVPGQDIKPLPEALELDARLRKVYMEAGVDDEELFREARSKRQKKREKREKKAKKVQTEPPSAAGGPLGSNIFALLGQGK